MASAAQSLAAPELEAKLRAVAGQRDSAGEALLVQLRSFLSSEQQTKDEVSTSRSSGAKLDWTRLISATD